MVDELALRRRRRTKYVYTVTREAAKLLGALPELPPNGDVVLNFRSLEDSSV